MSRTFSEVLMREVFRSAGNAFPLNYDPVSLAKRHLTLVDRLRNWVEKLGVRRNFFRLNPASSLGTVDRLSPFLPGIEWLYSQLADDWSRDTLARIIAYRILGPSKVKMPVDRDEFWDSVSSLDALADHSRSIDAGFRGWKLPLVDLNSLSIPVVLHTNPAGAHIIFTVEQYAYRHGAVNLEARNGDVVMDLGGCWGDTALYFAHKVGQAGKVFSFEFMPHNLSILRTNLALNTELQGRIEVVKAPVWSKSGETLSFEVNGPGSRAIKDSPVGSGAVQAVTVALDDFARDRKLPSVDFIKMDIEGAEMDALRGAEATIRKFRPILAIAVYHSLQDLVTIPKWIAALGIDYQLYLGHYSVNEWETILFCRPLGKSL